ncbi:MAG: dihydroneopterin aldolase [Lautropia sp.]|jgi:folB|nr:MAG: dihydroneopterin aldolase [Lautropia sp.]
MISPGAFPAMSEQSPHIFLKGLSVDSLIGVYPEERRAPQPLLIDVEVGLPSLSPFLTDQFGQTIDYAGVAELVRHEAAQQRFQLLERMAHHLCETIATRFHAPWVRMAIVKPGIVPGADAVGVRYCFRAPVNASGE